MKRLETQLSEIDNVGRKPKIDKSKMRLEILYLIPKTESEKFQIMNHSGL